MRVATEVKGKVYKRVVGPAMLFVCCCGAEGSRVDSHHTTGNRAAAKVASA